jgi:release factor glutamine methyltransferase
MAEQVSTILYLHGECVLRIPQEHLLPEFGDLLLVRHLPLQEGDRVANLSCGAGLVGILTAQRGHRVVATDRSAACCHAARSNALLNGVGDRVDVRHGDLFSPVAGEQFDLIAASPPQMPTPPDREWPDDESQRENAGCDGWAVLERIIAEAPAHLAPGGRLAFTLFGFLGLERALARLRTAGLAPQILARDLQPLPSLVRERLEHIRRLDVAGTLPLGRPATCSRFVLCGRNEKPGAESGGSMP